MNDRIKNVMDTFKSFTETWIQCGGSFITWDEFKHMSASSFIEMLGEKNITFNPPKNDIEFIPKSYDYFDME